MAADPQVSPLTVTVRRATEITGLGETSVFALMKSGTFERVKYRRRTLISYASIERWHEEMRRDSGNKVA
jgi:hypothetical protein